MLSDHSLGCSGVTSSLISRPVISASCIFQFWLTSNTRNPDFIQRFFFFLIVPPAHVKALTHASFRTVEVMPVRGIDCSFPSLFRYKLLHTKSLLIKADKEWEGSAGTMLECLDGG